MKDENMDALVVMDPYPVAILLNYWHELHAPTGIESREWSQYVVILSSGHTFAVRAHRTQYAPWIKEFVGRSAYPSEAGEESVQVLARALKEKGLGNARIGFELSFVPVITMDWIKSELPGIEVVDGDWIVWKMRALKTKKQIGFIQKAVDACEAGIKNLQSVWKEGESLNALLNQFEQVVKKHGASFIGCYQNATAKKWISFSGRDQYLSEDFVIRAHDEVWLDLLVRYQGFCSDWKRSFYIGTPSREIADIYEQDWKIIQAVAEEIKPGMTPLEAQESCDQMLKREGLIRWWCVHSVGLMVHEEPLIGTTPIVTENGKVDVTKTRPFPGLLGGRNKKITFDPSVVVMVESTKGEDPYLMTEDGLKRLNTLPQELFVF